MLIQILIAIAAIVLTALPMVRLESPAVLSPIRASGASEVVLVRILAPFILAAALALPFFISLTLGETVSAAVPSSDINTILSISIGSLAAVLVSSVIHPFCGAPYAVMGAVLGCSLMANGSIDFAYAGRLILGWMAAAVLSAVLSGLFSAAFHKYATKGGRHLAEADRTLLIWCIFTSLLLVAAVSFNMGQLVSVLPLKLLGGGIAGTAVFVAAVAFLCIIFSSRISSASEKLADAELDAGTSHILAVMLSMGITFTLFSLPVMNAVGLMPVPLSAGALMMASLTGTAIARKDSTVSGNSLVRSLLATVASPVLGLLAGYCTSLILNAGGSTPDGISLVPILSILGIAAVCAGFYFYFRASRREAREEEILRLRKEQVYSTQKSLSALEVKAETTEKDLLNKLEIKRKELVDFAVGVSDQKAFMEEVYALLAKAKNLPDGPEKDAALEEILAKLRERMYFTHEMHDFYARTEVLHRDFNMHLKEAYPNLTENERKLANLLRQGFSSKYIASLMNITPKSVEISRYRLRSKLGLSRSDNLVQFIKSI